MTLNYPWKVYLEGTSNVLCYHYISETIVKKVGDELNTTEGKFIIKKINHETREILV